MYKRQDFTLWVKLTGERWYESMVYEDIEHFVYDSNSMVERINQALAMDDYEYSELSYKCIEHAKKFNIYDVYSKFLELI